jgi:trehalose-phosphatase
MSGLPPSALERLGEILALLPSRRPAVFLDFDGTLAPIAGRPEVVELAPPTRSSLAALARRCPVAVVSGRDAADVRSRVGLDALWYAGSHGFEIAGPDGSTHCHARGIEALPELDAAERALRSELDGVEGAIVERKRFSLAAHYRLAAERDVARVERAVEAAAARSPGLRLRRGKKVVELQPRADWDKGWAVLWLLTALHLEGPDVLPIYLGDDQTDEDAFRAVAGRGVGIAVLDSPRPTAAGYSLRDPAEVRRFLDGLAGALGR